MSQLDEAESELLLLMFIVEFKWICVVFPCVCVSNTEDAALNVFNDF